MQKEREVEAIPILFQRPINQLLYTNKDFEIAAQLDQINSKIYKNKDPSFVIIMVLHIRAKQIVLSYEKKPKNRLMALMGNSSPNNFLFLSFDIYKTNSQFAKKCLTHPIVINKEMFNFFGYSKSNLKSFNCYFYKGLPDEIRSIFNSFGEFDKIKSISKKAARLSLLYSESNFVCDLQTSQIHKMKDIERNGVCFSDGCGYISLPLARIIKKHIGNLEYLPSVYQIRIKGIKGILLINPEYESEEIAVRQSMIKFQARKDKLKELVLINYSKPTHFAAINEQIIMLLSGLGVSDQYFLQLQKNFLDLLREAMIDPAKNIELLKLVGKQQTIEQILRSECNREFKVKSIISQQIYKNIKSKELKNRLKIPIEKARFLYGAVYPEIPQQKQDKKILLKENQIFLRVTTNKGEIKTIVGKVIVTKNPCYFCGDIRVLEAVDISNDFPFANKLVDVIIFSTEGDTPICTKIAGSDYDGDQYFVCWDKFLIPKLTAKPYQYPMAPLKMKDEEVTQNDLINYFVDFDRTIVSKIDSRFKSFAAISKDGVRSQECIDLGTKLFSNAIDSVNTGKKVALPDHLRFPNKEQQRKNHVWIKMARVYEQFFSQEFKFDERLIQSWDVTYEKMMGIIQTYIANQNYKDYQLFKIIKSWYLTGKSKNYKLFQYIDFSELTSKQKEQVVDLPNFPKTYFGNPFDNSPIFSNHLFNKVKFHSYENQPKKWRPYYKSQGDQIVFEILEQALQKFHNVLIGIQVNQQVSLVFGLINIIKTSYLQNSIPIESLVSYYAGNNELKKANFNKDYKLFYSDELFQIYEKQRRNSFFWFKENKVSIDLTRFDRNMLNRHQKINKQTIQSIQIYVGLSENFKVPKIEKLVVEPYEQIKQVKFQSKASDNKKWVQKKKKWVQKKQ